MTAKQHILVVEDEEHLATGIRYNLDAEGYRVTAVGDGPSALRAIEENPGGVDLVILDLMLPGMSGYAVCEALRAADKDLPVLILSARTLAEDRTRGFDVGANQYLTKPFDLDEFLSRVKNLLVLHGGGGGARADAIGPRNLPRVRPGQGQFRDIPGNHFRRAGADDPARDDPPAVLRRERGPGNPSARAAGKRLEHAGQFEHPGSRPVHSAAAQGL